MSAELAEQLRLVGDLLLRVADRLTVLEATNTRQATVNERCRSRLDRIEQRLHILEANR